MSLSALSRLGTFRCKVSTLVSRVLKDHLTLSSVYDIECVLGASARTRNHMRCHI